MACLYPQNNMNTFYLKLQVRMLDRQLLALGVHPILGYLLVGLVFVIFSIMLFEKTNYAAVIYIFFAINLISKFSNISRNNFLESCFERNNYLKLRILENLIITAPFAIFLLLKANYLATIILIFLSGISAKIKFRNNLNIRIPTPFYKKPFEFIVGFRSTILVFPLILFLLFQALQVHNFNLGVFALGLTFMVVFSYYFNVEERYFVWIFKESPARFLRKKIFIALFQASILTIPVCIICAIINVNYLPIILAIQLIGYIYLIVIILAKYASFPDAVSLPQTILLVISLFIPLLLLYTFPIFYKRSITCLNQILL